MICQGDSANYNAVHSHMCVCLHRKEMKEWSEIMLQRMAELKPLVLCFNGKGIYEIYKGKKCDIGIQDERLPGTDTVKFNEHLYLIHSFSYYR